MNNPSLGFDPKKLMAGLVRKGKVSFCPKKKPAAGKDGARVYQRNYKRRWREARRAENEKRGAQGLAPLPV